MIQSILTETGYRLYDNKVLEKLQEILFFRELEIPLMDIKKIMDTPDYDKEQILITQKILLEQKRNRLNGIIELITNVMKGVNTMSFEAFNNDEVQKIVNHTLECMSKVMSKISSILISIPSSICKTCSVSLILLSVFFIVSYLPPSLLSSGQK